MSVSLDDAANPAFTVSTHKSALARQFAAFTAIGAGSAIGFVVLSSLLVRVLPIPAWIVSLCCYAAFVLPAYLAHRRFSFRSQAAHRAALSRYVGTQLLCVALAGGLSYLVYRVAGLAPPIAPLFVVGVTSGISFCLLKLWAFAQ